MFLTEGYDNINEVSADPYYSMELVQEATEQWNDLCMKMIVLEHTAIVSEDNNLLSEASASFKERAKTLATRVYQKFIEYLERVRVEWSKLQATIATKVVSTNMVNALRKNANGQPFIANEQAIDKGLAVLDAVKKVNDISAESLFSAGTQASHFLSLAEELTDTKAVQTKLSKQLVDKAIKFLINRGQAVKDLQKTKSKASALYKEDLANIAKDQKDVRSNGKLLITLFQRSVNKLIIAINKITSSAIAVCKAVRRNSKVGEQINAAKGLNAVKTGKPVKVKNESTDPFDMFDEE